MSDYQVKKSPPEWISMQEATRHAPYSQEYLSLLARRGKIFAKKIGRNWYTTKETLERYVAEQAVLASALKYASPATFKTVLAEAPVGGVPVSEKPMSLVDEFKRLNPEKIEDKKPLSSAAPAAPVIESTPVAPAPAIEESAVLKKLDRLSDSLETFASSVAQAAQQPAQYVAPVEAAPVSRFARLNGVSRSIAKTPVGLMAVMIAAVVFVFVLVGGFSFGQADAVALRVKKAFSDATTIDGHFAGTHANEVLLLDKDGNVNIYGHIETQGQIRSYAPDGVAPFVVDSMTKVENLNASYLDGLASQSFTLAFVTKNGNLTYDDVKFEGNVEVGKTLQVHGATKLMDSLQVYGTLGVFSDAVFGKDVTLTNGNLIIATGTIKINNAALVKNLNAEYLDGVAKGGINLQFVTSNGSATTNTITVGGITSTGVGFFNGGVWGSTGSFGTLGAGEFQTNKATIGDKSNLSNGTFQVYTSQFSVDQDGNTSTGNLTVKNFVQSNLTPGGSFSLGTAAHPWSDLFVGNGTFTGNLIVSGSLNFAGTSSNSFVINTDNASTDTESSYLSFSRGTIKPGAQLAWNATTKQFSFNQPVTVASGSFSVAMGPVSIGTTSANPSALLDLSSTTRGFLAPRMTQVQRDSINSPAAGLLIFNSDTNTYNAYNGSTWLPVGALKTKEGFGLVQANSNTLTFSASGFTLLASGSTDTLVGIDYVNGPASRSIAQTITGLWTFANGASVSTNLEIGGYASISNTLLVRNGQVAVGTTTPVSSALLDLSSTTRGFLAPRMTQAQRDAITSPAAGLLIFNTDTSTYNAYNGSTWLPVGALKTKEGGSTIQANSNTLTFSLAGFNLIASGSTDTLVGIDYLNGPASRSIAQSITGLWTFVNGASVSTNLEIGGTASIGGNILTKGLVIGSGTGSNSFAGSLDLNKGLRAASITGSGLTINGNSILNGALTVSGLSSLSNASSSGSFEAANNLIANNVLQVGGTTAVSYSRFGTGTTSHSNYVNASNDLLVSGDLEVIGTGSFNSNVVLGTSSTNNLIVSANIKSDLIPFTNAFNLGSTTNHWGVEYVDTLHVTTLDAPTASISGTSATDFLINSDNVSADAENESITFERGTPTINAALRWDTTNKRFNLNFPLLIQGTDSAETAYDFSQLFLKGTTDQVGHDYITIQDSTGANRFRVSDGGASVSVPFEVASRASISGPLQVGGGATNVSYSRFGAATTTHGLSSATDLLVSGKLEVAGNTYFNAGTIANFSIASASYFYAQSGTAASPSFSFGVDQNTGIFRKAADSFSISAGGLERLNLTNTTASLSNALYTSSGNVGIGTSNPLATLNVSGTAEFGTSAWPTSTFTQNGSKVLISDTTTPALVINNSNNPTANAGAEIYLGARGTNATNDSAYVRILGARENAATGNFATYFNLKTMNSAGAEVQALRIDSAGNIGINSVTPTQKFSIVGNAGVQDLLNIASSSGSSYLFVKSNGNVGIGSSTPNAALDVVGTASISSNFGVGSKKFYVNTASGNVGINFGNSLDAKLEVGGTASVSGTLTLGGIITSSNTGSNSFQGSINSNLGIHATGNLTTAANVFGIQSIFSGTGSNSFAGSINTTLGIHSTGNHTTLGQFFSSGTGSNSFSGSLDLSKGFRAAAITGSGLSINGNTNLNGPLTVTNLSSLSNASSSGTFEAASNVIANNVVQVGGTTALSYSRFGTGTTAHSLSANSDVLITGNLEVQGSLFASIGSASSNFDGATDNTYQLGNSAYRWKNISLAPNGLLISSTTGTSGAGANYTQGQIAFGSGSSLSFGTSAVGTGNAGSLALQTAGTNRLFISSGGNVGIGEKNPLAKLDVAGSVIASSSGNVAFTLRSSSTHGTANNNDAQFTLQTSSTSERFDIRNGAGANLFTIASTGGVNIIAPNGSSSLAFSSNITPNNKVWMQYLQGNDLRFYGNADRLTLTQGGNIGIGTTVPNAQLQIVGNGGNALLSIASASGTSAFYISKSGNVGIGTNNPAATLAVAGNTAISGNAAITGNLTVSGSITGAFTVSSNSSNFDPSIDNTYSLGNTAYRWKGITVGTSVSSFGGNIGIGTTVPLASIHAVPSVIQNNSASCTGCTTVTSGGYTIMTFTASGSFNPTNSFATEVLTVGGGGGGGNSGNGGVAGGGGGGGQVLDNSFGVIASSYRVTVGTGGLGAIGSITGTNGSAGTSSAFSTLATALGGGGGGNYGNTNGGSGANGGGSPPCACATTGGTGTTGFNGGAGYSSALTGGAGGGGGAGGTGGAGFVANGGAGGAGLSNTISGSSVAYGGGGGGAAGSGGTGGVGTGGGGTGSVSSATGTSGTNGTGGGGGGSQNGNAATRSGKGGSGVVIVKFLTQSVNAAGVFMGNVGIGTTSPGYALDVVGTINSNLINTNGLNVNGIINATGLTVNGAAIGSGTSQWTTSSSDIYYNTGNVAIGTTSPSNAKLKVAATGNQTLSAVQTTLAGNGIQIEGTVDGGYQPGIVWTAANNNQNQPKAGIWVRNDVGATGTGQLYFGTSNASGAGITNTAMVIDQNGNIGIGTRTPTSLLSVAGTASISNTFFVPSTGIANVTGNLGIGTTTPAAKLTVEGTNDTLANVEQTMASNAILIEGTNANYLPGMMWSTSNNNPNRPKAGIWAQMNTNGGTGNSSLYFGTANGGGASGITSTMVLDANGNVGIGSTAPGVPLEVTNASSFPNGVIRANSADTTAASIVINNTGTGGKKWGLLSTGGAAGAGAGAFAIFDQTDNFYALTALANGNVGIGTTAPAYKLEVAGAINATALNINGVPVATGTGTQWSSGTGGIISYSGGNVGIGTNNPAAILEVKTANATLAQFYNTTNSGNADLYLAGNNAGGAAKYFLTRVVAKDSGGTGAYYLMPNGGASAFTILAGSTNKVGIGTSNPNSLLDIASASAKFTIRSSGTTASASMVFQPAGGASSSNEGAFTIRAGGLASTAGERLDFINGANTTLFTIASAGNVGIGSTIPTQKLDVAGNINASTGLYLGGGASGLKINSSGNAGIGSTNLTSTFTVGGTASISGNVFLANLGVSNVGIGTTAPASKLEVNGSIRLSQGSGGKIIFADGTTMSSAASISSTFIPSSIGDLNLIGDSDNNGSGGLNFVTGNSSKLSIANDGTITPGTDNTQSLGSANLRFKDIFVGNGSYKLSSTTTTNGSGTDYTLGRMTFSAGSSLSFGTSAVGAGSGGSLALQTNGTNRLFVSGAGNIGINTTTTNAMLTLVGAAGNNALVSIASSSGAPLFFIAKSGNVGIGTGAPTSTLGINGTLAVSGNLATTALEATGGNISHAGGYTIHTFLTNGTFTMGAASTSVQYLVVAGGGGGGSLGGGGGGGGMRTGTFAVTASSYTVVVGAGGAGAGANGLSGSQGASSSFSTLKSTGGGGGQGNSGGGTLPGKGGSGGGSESATIGTGNSPATSPSQGNDGGHATGGVRAAAGGGGAGGVGVNNSGSVDLNSAGTAGGPGLASSISGSSVTYAGGGGGAGLGTGNNGGAGGSGGGGAGGNGDNSPAAVAGTAYTGGGGGGGGYNGSTFAGAAGGTGIVIVRYKTPAPVTAPGTSFTVDAVGNVGIGTGTPTSKLDVKGAVNVDGNANINGTLTSHGGMTILCSNTGTDTTSSAANVALCPLSGLSANDTVMITWSLEATGQNTTGPMSIYNSTDGINLTGILAASSGVGVGSTTVGQTQLFTSQLDNHKVSAVNTYEVSGTGAITNFSSGQTTMTTSWTGSWTLALHHGGVTSGGALLYSWKVYKVSGSTDVAENYPSDQQLQPGDVVSFAAIGGKKIEKAGADSTAVAGIVSTAPGITLGEGVGASLGDAGLVFGQKSANDYPLALNGRVPVKVSSENGDIHVGDRLTVSATLPGYAMKMTAAGQSIGIALQDFPSVSITDGKILAFVNLGYWAPSASTLDTTPPTQTASGSYNAVSFNAGTLTATHLFVTDANIDTLHITNQFCLNGDCRTSWPSSSTMDLSSYAKLSDLTAFATIASTNAQFTAVNSSIASINTNLATLTASVSNLYAIGLGNPNSSALQGVQTGNIIPFQDNAYDIGSPTHRVANIYGANIQAGDLTYAETTSALSGATLATGDILGLYVNSTSGGTHTVPITLSYAIGSIAGNIGIGTTSPTAKLEVNGGIKLKAGSGGTITFADGTTMSTAVSANAGASSIGDVNISADTDLNGSGGINLVTNGTAKLTILNNGNVGIGTAAPGSALAVVGNTSITGNLTVSGTINGAFGLTASSASNFDPGTDNTYSLGNSAFRFNTVNAGPTGYKLSSTTGTSGIGSNYTLGTTAFTSGSSLSFGTSAVGSGSGGSVALQTNGTTQIYVAGNGNVGIGVTNPKERMVVNGVLALAEQASTSLPSATPGYGKIYAVNTGSIDASTTMLLHFDGNNGSTSILDSAITPHVMTTHGNTTLSSAQSKFGGTSAVFTATNGDYISTPNSTDLQMGVSNFTIEFWVYYAGTCSASHCTILSKGYTGSGALLLQTDTSASPKMQVFLNAGLTAIESTGATTGVWHHYAIVRNGTAVTIYRDGLSTGTGTDSSNLNDSSAVNIGEDIGQANYVMNGYIDEMRISKGLARYTSNFTVPTGPYQTTGLYWMASNGQNYELSTTLNSTVNSWTVSGGNIYYNSGNVSIGTTTGTVPLNVAAIDGGTALETYSPAGVPRFALNNNSNGSWTMYDRGNGSSFVAGITQNSGNVGIGTQNVDAKLEVAGTASISNSFFVAANGNIGLGTTSPASGVLVDVRKTGAGVQDGLYMINAQAAAAGVGEELSFSDPNQRQATIQGAWTGAATTDGYLAFRTRQSNSLAEAMRITNTGNVGIGTTSPTQMLHLYGGSSVDAGIRISSNAGSTNNILKVVDATFGLQIQNGIGTSLMAFNNTSGNVGIGTTNPTAKLEVNGGIKITAGSGAGLTFQDGTTISSNAAAGAGVSSNTDVSLAADADANGSGVMTFATHGAERMRIDNSGNVGIGTTNPYERLQVRGSGTDTGNVTQDTASRRIVAFDDSDATRGGQLFISGTNVPGNQSILFDSEGTAGASGLAFATRGLSASAIRMVITAAGNVGIGTTNPNSILDIASASAKFTIRSTSATASASIAFQPAGGASNSNQGAFTIRAGGLASTAGERLDFINGANNTLFTIASAGNIGIGSTVPSQLLDLGGAAGNIAFSGTGNHQIITAGSGNLSLNVAGNVGVGTTAPTSKLEVNGNIKLSAASGGKIIFADGTTMSTAASASTGLPGGATSIGDVNIVGDSDQNGTGGINFVTNGTSKMTILNNGNIGIGSSVPTALLDVAGSGHFTGSLAFGANASVSTAFEVGGYASVGGNGTFKGNLSIGTTNSAAMLTVVGAAGNNALVSIASSSGSPLFFIAKSGNVGIGTGSPTSTLGVAGTFAVTGNVTTTAIEGTGGIVSHAGGYTIHTFFSSGSFVMSTASTSIQYLVVGGGGGGADAGGGGGAGGMRTGTFAVTASSYTITVGAGGAGASVAATAGSSGASSSFSNLIKSTGGGGGGSYGAAAAKSGGSGGGSTSSTIATGNTPATVPSQGNDGGHETGGTRGFSGGGGAGAAGTNNPGTVDLENAGTAGGAGAISAISGASVTYAGGGGGGGASQGGSNLSGGAGGSSIGGTGGSALNSPAATAGAPNTGSGGGGGGFSSGVNNYAGAAGGSGIVIVRYKTPTAVTAPGTAFTVDSTGNVGIGTGTPTAKLDVKGAVNVDGNANINGTLTSHGGMTILCQGAGNDSSTSTTTLLTCPISSMSPTDKLYVVLSQTNLTGASSSPILYSVTDSLQIAGLGNGPNTTSTQTVITLGTDGVNTKRIMYNALVGGGATGVTASVTTVTTDWTAAWNLAFKYSGSTSGTTYSYDISIYKVNGSTDVAENYPSDQQLQPGDVVSFAAIGGKKIEKADGTTTLAGIVSTAPGITLGEGHGISMGDSGITFGQKAANEYPLALNGRVPVNITDENGPVKVGDRITASATKPGFAMKQTTAGQSIGIALESFPNTASGSFSNTASGSASSPTEGKVLAFVNLGYWMPTMAQINSSVASGSSGITVSVGSFGDIASQSQTLITTIQTALTKVQNLWAAGDIIAQGIKKTYYSVASLFNGIPNIADAITHWGSRDIAIDPRASDTTKSLFSGNAAQAADQSKTDLQQNGAYLATYGVDSTRGEIQLSGSSQIVNGVAKVFFDYSFSSIISPSTPIKVITTPTSVMQGQVYVDSKSQYGFTVKELNSQDNGTFDWLVIARRKGFDSPVASGSPSVVVTPPPANPPASPSATVTPTPTPSDTPAPSVTPSPTPTPSDTPAPTETP